MNSNQSSSTTAIAFPMESLLRAWGQIQRELLYLTWALMDVAIITPIVLTLLPWARYWPPGTVLLWLWLLMLLPFNLSRLMGEIGLSAERQRTIMVFALLLTLFFTLQTLLYDATSLFDFSWTAEFLSHLGESGNLLWLRDLAIFLFSVFMWLRGIFLVGRKFEINRAGLRLRVGGLIIAPLVIWFSNGRLLWDTSSFLLLFFLSGLACIALVRAEEISNERVQASPILHPRWFSTVLAASLLIIFIAGTLTALITGDTGSSVFGWFSPLWAAISLGSTVIGITITYFAFPLLDLVFAILIPLLQLLRQIGTAVVGFILWIISLFLGDPPPPPESAPPAAPTFAPTPGDLGLGDLSQNSDIFALLLMLAVVLLVSLTLTRLYKQAQLASQNGATITHDEEEEEDTPGKKLLRRLGLWRGWRAAASIRRVYRQMCQAATAVGYPRSESETPYEYLKTLAKAWPENTADSRLITQAFVKIRYGELPETPEELEAILQAWQRLEQTKPSEAVSPTP